MGGREKRGDLFNKLGRLMAERVGEGGEGKKRCQKRHTHLTKMKNQNLQIPKTEDQKNVA